MDRFHREEYTNFNPSLVRLNTSLIEGETSLTEYGEFLVAKRLDKDACAILNDNSTKKDPISRDGIILQALDSYLNPFMQTYMQVC